MDWTLDMDELEYQIIHGAVILKGSVEETRTRTKRPTREYYVDVSVELLHNSRTLRVHYKKDAEGKIKHIVAAINDNNRVVWQDEELIIISGLSAFSIQRNTAFFINLFVKNIIEHA